MTVKNHIYCAIAISIVIRCLLFFQIYPDTNVISSSDQAIYINLSEYFFSNLDFSGAFGSVRLPFYPMFLALCKLFSGSLFFVLIVQHLIGLVSIPIISQIGGLFSRQMAIFCGYFAAINFNFIIESNLILTESIFYPIFALFYYYLIRFTLKKQDRDILKTAIILGICTLIRPVTMYLPIFMIFYLIIAPEIQIRKRAILTVSFVVLFFVTISPWLYRNYVVYNEIGLTTQGESHIVGFVIPYVMQYEDNINLAQAKKKSMALWREKMDSLPDEYYTNPFQLDQKAKQFGLSYLIQASPVSIFKAWFWGGMKNVFSPVTVELSFLLDIDRTLFGESKGETVPEQLYNFVVKNKSKAYSVLMITGLLSILVFRSMQLIGAWHALVDDRKIMFVFFLVVAYFLIVSGPVGYAKYRIPLEPIFIVLSAFCFKKPVKIHLLRRWLCFLPPKRGQRLPS